jgi:hypothetical protein
MLTDIYYNYLSKSYNKLDEPDLNNPLPSINSLPSTSTSSKIKYHSYKNGKYDKLLPYVTKLEKLIIMKTPIKDSIITYYQLDIKKTNLEYSGVIEIKTNKNTKINCILYNYKSIKELKNILAKNILIDLGINIYTPLKISPIQININTFKSKSHQVKINSQKYNENCSKNFFINSQLLNQRPEQFNQLCESVDSYEIPKEQWWNIMTDQEKRVYLDNDLIRYFTRKNNDNLNINTNMDIDDLINSNTKFFPTPIKGRTDFNTEKKLFFGNNNSNNSSNHIIKPDMIDLIIPNNEDVEEYFTETPENIIKDVNEEEDNENELDNFSSDEEEFEKIEFTMMEDAAALKNRAD